MQASATRPTGVASRRDMLPTVLPPLWGKVLDGNLLSTTFVKTKVLPATFVWSNVMLAIFAQSNGAAATFAQANVLPETLMQSDVVPATLVDSTVLQPRGGEVSGGTLLPPALPAPGGANLVVDVRAAV